MAGGKEVQGVGTVQSDQLGAGNRRVEFISVDDGDEVEQAGGRGISCAYEDGAEGSAYSCLSGGVSISPFFSCDDGWRSVEQEQM